MLEKVLVLERLGNDGEYDADLQAMYPTGGTPSAPTPRSPCICQDLEHLASMIDERAPHLTISRKPRHRDD
jgi:hypothetical protein